MVDNSPSSVDTFSFSAPGGKASRPFSFAAIMMGPVPLPSLLLGELLWLSHLSVGAHPLGVIPNGVGPPGSEHSSAGSKVWVAHVFKSLLRQRFVVLWHPRPLA